MKLALKGLSSPKKSSVPWYLSFWYALNQQHYSLYLAFLKSVLFVIVVLLSFFEIFF